MELMIRIFDDALNRARVTLTTLALLAELGAEVPEEPAIEPPPRRRKSGAKSREYAGPRDEAHRRGRPELTPERLRELRKGKAG